MPLSIRDTDAALNAGICLDKALAGSTFTLHTKIPDDIKNSETGIGKVRMDIDVLTGLRAPADTRNTLENQVQTLTAQTRDIEEKRLTLLKESLALIKQHQTEAPSLFSQYAEEKIQRSSAISIFTGWMKRINGTISNISSLTKISKQTIREVNKLHTESTLAIAKVKGALVTSTAPKLT